MASEVRVVVSAIENDECGWGEINKLGHETTAIK